MNYEAMEKDDLIARLRQMDAFLDNVVVFWGGKRELRQTLEEVAENKEGAYTDEEARNARTILETEGLFDQFIEMLKKSFELGGINFAVQENMTSIMQAVASRQNTVS